MKYFSLPVELFIKPIRNFRPLFHSGFLGCTLLFSTLVEAIDLTSQEPQTWRDTKISILPLQLGETIDLKDTEVIWKSLESQDPGVDEKAWVMFPSLSDELFVKGLFFFLPNILFKESHFLHLMLKSEQDIEMEEVGSEDTHSTNVSVVDDSERREIDVLGEVDEKAREIGLDLAHRIKGTFKEIEGVPYVMKEGMEKKIKLIPTTLEESSCSVWWEQWQMRLDNMEAKTQDALIDLFKEQVESLDVTKEEKSTVWVGVLDGENILTEVQFGGTIVNSATGENLRIGSPPKEEEDGEEKEQDIILEMTTVNGEVISDMMEAPTKSDLRNKVVQISNSGLGNKGMLIGVIFGTVALSAISGATFLVDVLDVLVAESFFESKWVDRVAAGFMGTIPGGLLSILTGSVIGYPLGHLIDLKKYRKHVQHLLNPGARAQEVQVTDKEFTNLVTLFSKKLSSERNFHLKKRHEQEIERARKQDRIKMGGSS